METIKGYTDLEQSRKLAEFLPLESADMAYIKHSSSNNPTWEFNEDFPPMILGNVPINELTVEALPCWSLAALYGILPNNKKESTSLSRGGWKIEPPEYVDKWWCEYEDDDCTKDFSVSADNPVDACYEMIIKLHELNLL
jgi:hypothetical protein